MQELKHAYDTRHDNISKLYNYIQSGISVAAPKIWSQPSTLIKLFETTATFHNKLKTSLFEVTFLVYTLLMTTLAYLHS